MLNDSQLMCICTKILFHHTCVFYMRAKWEEGDRLDWQKASLFNGLASYLVANFYFSYFLLSAETENNLRDNAPETFDHR